MRYLSKLIKSDNLVMAFPRKLVEITKAAAPLPCPAEETAEKKPDREEIIESAREKARGVYESAREEGDAAGREEGNRAGAVEAERRVREALAAAEEQRTAQALRLQNSREKAARALKEQTLSFAFGLASAVLGYRLEKNRDVYGCIQNLSEEVFLEDFYLAKASVQALYKTGYQEGGASFRLSQLLCLTLQERRVLLDSVDKRYFALALKGADEEAIKQLFGNTGDVSVEALMEEMTLLGPQNENEVMDAWKKIAAVLYTLKSDHKIQTDRGAQALAQDL